MVDGIRKTILERMTAALHCLCGAEESFEKRMSNAWREGVSRLGTCDPMTLADELTWLREVCDKHLQENPNGMTEFSEQERFLIVDYLVAILIDTARETKRG